MPIPKSILNYLDKNKVKYEIIKHRIVYTAYDKAVTLGLKPQQVAKTVIVSLDGKGHAIALIPANKNLDKKKLLALANKQRQKVKLSNYKKIDFVGEQWMKKALKGIRVGATPPFGVIYKLPAFVDNALAKQPKLVVNAGDYQNSLKITTASMFKLNKTATKGSFSQAKK